MLNWLIAYLNYNGYYIYDSNCYNYNNYTDYNYNNQQQYSARSRYQRNRCSRRNAVSNFNNEKAQEGPEKPKTLEVVNLKEDLKTKIEESNKGKGLGKNTTGILKPIMIEHKSDRKCLGALVSPKTVDRSLSKKQTKNLRSKEVEKGVQKLNQQAVANKKDVGATKQTQKPKARAEVDTKKVLPATKQKQKLKQEPKKQVVAALAIESVTTAKTAKTAEQAENPLHNSYPKINKEGFSCKDPCTPEFLMSLGHAFKSEIEIMQLRLQAEASLKPVHTDNDLIVVKIYIENNPSIADHVFEFIRIELVGWIGMYQQEGMETPVFHSITNNKSSISIVCDNKYAFECVERCIEDILEMKTMSSLKVIALPPLTPLIYCFDAKYDGIASDSGLFLSQLRLHKPKLYSYNWVVASHKVCSEERKTYFIFLIDERSALALNFLYNQRFCICLQQVTFRSRGIVRETISK